MQVLIIQPWIRQGGAELITVHLAHELALRGHKASIVCTFRDLTGMPEKARTLEYRLPPSWLARLCRKHRSFFLLAGPWILLALTWRHAREVDVLNPHNFPGAWVASLVGAVRRLPVVWACNEPPTHLPLRDIRKVGVLDYLGWRLASSWIDNVMIRTVSSIYVPSEKTRRQVQDRYGRDAPVIPLGVDGEFFRDGDGSALRQTLGLSDAFVLLAVGKLHPQKNQIICIEALRDVAREIPNAVLVLAGAGPMLSEWRDLVRQWSLQDRVQFLGHQSSQAVRNLYGACDVNLFPPLDQSWGFTPFEALCAGKISIVSDDSGAAEVVAKEQIGVVAKPVAAGFARSILELGKAPERCRKMAARGRRYVLRNLSWEAHARKVENLIGRAAGMETNGQ